MRHLLLAAALCLAGGARAQSYEEMAAARDQLLAGETEEALAVIEPAARRGHLRAMNLLGAAYQYGIGVEADGRIARDLLDAAAAQNYAPAVHNLAVLFQRGAPGVVPDFERAVETYQRAIELDYAPSMGTMVGILMDGPGSEAERAARALVLAERGAFLGNDVAAHWLGWFRYNGLAGPVDHDEARRLFMLAAALGNADAMTAYGGMLEAGEGGHVDRDGALDWYARAAAAGDPDGAIQLAERIGNAAETADDRILALARCRQGLDLAGGAALESWRRMCAEIAAGLDPAQIRQAEKMARTF